MKKPAKPVRATMLLDGDVIHWMSSLVGAVIAQKTGDDASAERLMRQAGKWMDVCGPQRCHKVLLMFADMHARSHGEELSPELREELTSRADGTFMPSVEEQITFDSELASPQFGFGTANPDIFS